MKKFIIFYTKQGGCDQTIGCGRCWEHAEAESIEALMEARIGTPEIHRKGEVDSAEFPDFNVGHSFGPGNEKVPDEMWIYEVTDHRNSSILKRHIKACREARIAFGLQEHVAKVEADERAELKRLKKKYEDD